MLILISNRQGEVLGMGVSNKLNQYEQIFYRLYHDSYRIFLNRKDIVEQAGIKIKDIKALMADGVWQDLYGNG